MKIVVINYSGNVGKSTVAQHLLLPRLQHSTLRRIESINSDGSAADELMVAKQFGELHELLLITDTPVIVDIGASNVEGYVNRMRQSRRSHEDYDYYVVPTVPSEKQIRDTISTIRDLAEMGVPADKIRLVFNQIDPSDDIASLTKTFPGLFEYYTKEGLYVWNAMATIHSNDVFPRLQAVRRSLADIVSDETDYLAMIKASNDTEEKRECAEMIGIKRLAFGAQEELDGVFAALFS